MSGAGLRGAIVRLALPAHAREAVLGDLDEEFGSGPATRPHRRAGRGRHVAALVGIVLHYQAAPYRDRDARFATTLLFGAGVALLWAVREAAWPGSVPRGGFDPVSEVALRFWGAPHLVGALAAGLFAGRFDALPGSERAARAHVAAALAGVAVILAPAGGGPTAALLLLAAAGIGAAARADADRACGARGAGRPTPPARAASG